MKELIKNIFEKFFSYFKKEENREKTSSKIVHGSAYAFSAFLDANFFMALASEGLGRLFLGGWGIVWTSLKLVMLRKYLYRKQERQGLSKEQLKKSSKGTLLLWGYLLFASISFSAAMGFLQLSILNQTQKESTTITESTNYQDKINRLNTEITQNDNTILQLEADKKSENDNYAKLVKVNYNITDQHNKILKDKENSIQKTKDDSKDKQKEIDSLNKEKNTIDKVKNIVVKDMYDVLATSIPFNNTFFKITGQNIQFVIGNLIGLAIEVALWVTTDIRRRKKINSQENRNNLTLYINTLFAVKGAKLTPDRIISERTGIPMLDCKRYRNLLIALQHDGRQLIKSGMGGSTANFSKEVIFEVLEENFIME